MVTPYGIKIYGIEEYNIMQSNRRNATSMDDMLLSAAAGGRELIWKRIGTITKEEIEEILGYEIKIVG